MKKSTVAATAALILVSAAPCALAEGNHFAGAYLTVTQEWKRPDVRVDSEKVSVSESAPSIGAGYNFELSPNAVLGLKLTADTRHGAYGEGETALGKTEVQEKSHYSIAVEPGWVVNDHLLVFGIAAYHRAKAELLVDDISQGAKHVSGLGLGVGFKYALPYHLFIVGEVQRTHYGSTTIAGASVKPTSDVVALGLGYHF